MSHSPSEQMKTSAAADDICISGIAGSFPNSHSVQHLADNLFNKVDLISGDDRRWTVCHPEIPQRTGKIYNVKKFDAEFFGFNFKEGHFLDTYTRILLERVYECLIDAGVNPLELQHTNTGVYVGTCVSESHKVWMYDRLELHDNDADCKRQCPPLSANAIAEWLDLKGPCRSVDTGCSSAIFALDHAFKAIQEGLCDQAIVTGLNLCLHPTVSLIFSRMGILSPDGRCKTFDNRANGYARSEAIVACYLQKAKHSKRVYAKIVHTKTNCDGYKIQGISFPGAQQQESLLEHFYAECGISPTTIEFVEAHGTGTSVGDPEELSAIDKIFCTGRKEPLFIGSIKSNLGHSEASSGLNSLAKACIAYNTGFIPPNINFKSPREVCPSLMEGRIRVVTEKQPWNRGRLTISSFGFGGANGHVLLENFSKPKINNGIPTDGIPRLVCVSGRMESSVARILDDLESRPVDGDLVRLWQGIHERDIPGHYFRGFVILDSTPSGRTHLARRIERLADVPKQRPVWFNIKELHSLWPAVAKQCMILPAFANAIHRCSSALQSKGIDVTQLFSENISNQQQFSTVGATAVYIGLIDILIAVGIKPDYVISSGTTQHCNAYAEELSTVEQTILAAYQIDTTGSNTVKHKTSVFQQKQVPSPNSVNAIVIEIGVHDSLNNHNGLDSFSKESTCVPLIQENVNYVQSILAAIGKLFLEGLNPVLANIYPPVTFPVAQGTPMMSHLVEWNHSDNWTVADFRNFLVTKMPFGSRKIKLHMTDDKLDYLKGHTIDDRVIFPGTGYVYLVWETFSYMTNRLPADVSVVFEEVYLHRATNLPKEGCLEFTVTIHVNGSFEITENKILVVTGRIRELNKNDSVSTLKGLRQHKKEEDGHNVTLSSKDVYKELNIRGYQYKGMFRGICSCSVDGSHGQLVWKYNWITFLDTMLQVTIVSHDTRALYVPTRIEKIVIDTDKHKKILAELEQSGDDLLIDFENNTVLNMTRAGGCEVRGIHVASINKKAPRGIPVLEECQFVANFAHAKMELLDLLRCNIQLIHENIQTYKFKNIELVDEEYQKNNLEPISENIAEILADLPLVQAEMLVLSDEPVTMPSNITVVGNKIAGETNAVLFVGANLLKRQNVLEVALATLRNECFILSRENTFQFDGSFGYDIITVFSTGTEYFVLLRKKINPRPTKYYKIDSQDLSFSWIDDIKNVLREEDQELVLYSQGEPVNGLLGLVNCLRKEPGGEMVRGLLIADPTAPPFNADCKLYKEHLDKGLGINVFANGQWGTYRHLLFKDLATIPVVRAYANTATIGDINSLKYWEGYYSENHTNPNTLFVHVYSAALNFRDAMIAKGRVAVDAVARGRLAQDCVQGLEIAGRTSNGTRVMGVTLKGISNLAEVNKNLLWPIPDEWTFQEAVTVPVAYLTVYLALVLMGKVRRGERILIHAGSGGVGQAAINVALHHGLEVFTTVGTPAKRAFIKRLFPTLKDSHIGNSRDTSFEYMIRRETNGEGVDVVLNSLSDDKLQASVKCLRAGGRFLEIGKYDITNNTRINTSFLQKEISFHSIMMDYSLEPEMEYLMKNLHGLFLAGIDSGAVRPLTNCSFDKYDLLHAYRYLAAGKHYGKITIKMREGEPAGMAVKPTPVLLDAVPRYMCEEHRVYVLVGGLGGFGLELADWLVLRGARKILMCSRKGVTKGYQALRIRIWKSYGAQIEICTHDVTTEPGCREMLKMAATMGPVQAIFNLAVVLNDAVFQNQTPETFRNSFAPKALTTILLDKLSRIYCPQLRDFVIFSSVSCGRGNAGQTNYGFSNSVMERICEQRKRDGLPAVAIQWGAIGDVGLVADMQEDNMQLEIGGTLQQRISSCMQVLDKFLKQDVTIVSSIVVAEKRITSSGTHSIVEVVANILGITDLKSVSLQAPLSEMGMDSVMAVEIKQTLEREYELFLSAQEIRLLTFARLKELVAQDSAAATVSAPSLTVSSDTVATEGLAMFIRNIGEEEHILKPYIFLKPNANETEITLANSKNMLFMVPGIESCASIFEQLCNKIDVKSCVLQLGLNYNEDWNQMVNNLYNIVKPVLRPGAPFSLLGYSFGSVVVLKLAARLESEGHEGIVFCVDGSPEFVKYLVNEFLDYHDNDNELENNVAAHCMSMICQDLNLRDTLMKKFKDLNTFEDKMECAIKSIPIKLSHSDEYILRMGKAIFNRIKQISSLELNSIDKLNSRIVLLRAKRVPTNLQCNEVYGLDKFTDTNVDLHYVDANHSNITDSEECAQIVNAVLDEFYQRRSETKGKRTVTQLIENNMSRQLI